MLDRLCYYVALCMPNRLVWWVLVRCMKDIAEYYGEPSEAFDAADYLPTLWEDAYYKTAQAKQEKE